MALGALAVGQGPPSCGSASSALAADPPRSGTTGAGELALAVAPLDRPASGSATRRRPGAAGRRDRARRARAVRDGAAGVGARRARCGTPTRLRAADRGVAPTEEAVLLAVGGTWRAACASRARVPCRAPGRRRAAGRRDQGGDGVRMGPSWRGPPTTRRSTPMGRHRVSSLRQRRPRSCVGIRQPLRRVRDAHWSAGSRPGERAPRRCSATRQPGGREGRSTLDAAGRRRAPLTKQLRHSRLTSARGRPPSRDWAAMEPTGRVRRGRPCARSTPAGSRSARAAGSSHDDNRRVARGSTTAARSIVAPQGAPRPRAKVSPGVVTGSMATPGYAVRGRRDAASLRSAFDGRGGDGAEHAAPTCSRGAMSLAGRSRRPA